MIFYFMVNYYNMKFISRPCNVLYVNAILQKGNPDMIADVDDENFLTTNQVRLSYYHTCFPRRIERKGNYILQP